MPLPNKGIAKAVREAFIGGTHDPQQMVLKLADFNTDQNRRAYIVTLTKALREKHGLQTKRNKRHGKKKTGAKGYQINFQFDDQKQAKSIHQEEAMQEKQALETYQSVKAARDYVTAEYVKLHDDYIALQNKYMDLHDKVEEFKREIARLNVVITYLEGRIK